MNIKQIVYDIGGYWMVSDGEPYKYHYKSSERSAVA